MNARLFIAVDPPPAVQAQLAGWARRAIEPGLGPPAARRGGQGPAGRPQAADRLGRAPSDGIRRVDAAALHITLCFLGDQPLDVVDELGELIRDSAGALAAAGVPVGPLGVGAPVWLPPRRPRALALEIHDESGGLLALYDDLRRGLADAIGWEPERRRLRPHVTVARLRSWGPPPVCREPSPPVVFEPAAVTLYRSRLEPEGAVYRALWRTPLAGSWQAGEH